jgi:predicted PolB exonuclease-like 3'-5' exonuclease
MKALFLNTPEYTGDLDFSKIWDDRAALYPEYGRIVAISFGFFASSKENERPFKIFTFVNDNEKTLIENFFKFFMLKFNTNTFKLVGGNIKFFDIPFILRKAITYGLAVPKYFYNPLAKPWEQNMFDIIEYYRANTTVGDATMDSICRVLGIESPKTLMDGSMVSKAYWEGEIDKIAGYCEKDTDAAKEVLLKMTNCHEFTPKR